MSDLFGNHIVGFPTRRLILFPEDSVWGDVSKMNDSIKVEYGKLEELFSQKVTSPPPNMLSPESEDVTTRARRNSHRETEVRRSW